MNLPVSKESKATESDESEDKNLREVLRILNNGSMDELLELYSIGKKRAPLIIKHRPFTSVDELRKIKGFGEKFVENFKALNSIN